MEKRFKIVKNELYNEGKLERVYHTVYDNKRECGLGVEECCEMLNRFFEIKEHWKQKSLDSLGEIQILHNELNIAMGKGYELSDAYKSYKVSKKEGIK